MKITILAAIILLPSVYASPSFAKTYHYGCQPSGDAFISGKITFGEQNQYSSRLEAFKNPNCSDKLFVISRTGTYEINSDWTKLDTRSSKVFMTPINPLVAVTLSAEKTCGIRLWLPFVAKNLLKSECKSGFETTHADVRSLDSDHSQLELTSCEGSDCSTIRIYSE